MVPETGLEPALITQPEPKWTQGAFDACCSRASSSFPCGFAQIEISRVLQASASIGMVSIIFQHAIKSYRVHRIPGCPEVQAVQENAGTNSDPAQIENLPAKQVQKAGAGCDF